MHKSFIPKTYRPIAYGACIDNRHYTHFKMNSNTCFYSMEHIKKYRTVIIGPKKDNVINLVIKHRNNDDKIMILYLDEIWQSWSFIANHNMMLFIIYSKKYGNVAISPELIYFRSAYIDDSKKKRHYISNLASFLNHWPGQVLCRPHQHQLNHSKLLQHTRSIIPAIKLAKANISIPESRVIKGSNAFKNIPKNNFITKSLSSQKTDVVDSSVYSQWDTDGLTRLPSLFQQLYDGYDIRIHRLFNKIVAIKIPKSIDTNYRYNTRKSTLEYIEVKSSIIKFCHSVANIENNPLLGIDLFKTNDGYICFEANPGPGWSAFHENEQDDGQSFLSYFMKVLRNGCA